MDTNKNLHCFTHPNYGNLRVYNDDGRYMFLLTDCIKALDSPNLYATVCNNPYVRNNQFRVQVDGARRYRRFLSENELMRCIMLSSSPNSRGFEQWIFDNLIPNMRSAPLYGQESEITMLSAAVMVAKEIITMQESKIDELLPKARYADKVRAITL